jgi:hypothetical protein
MKNIVFGMILGVSIIGVSSFIQAQEIINDSEAQFEVLRPVFGTSLRDKLTEKVMASSTLDIVEATKIAYQKEDNFLIGEKLDEVIRQLRIINQTLNKR